jgi:hypothetical protein
MKTTSTSEAREKSKLRFEAINEFVDRTAYRADLSLAAFSVWVIFWRNVRDDQTDIGVDVVLKSVKISRSTAMRAIRELTDKGLLLTARKGGIGRGTSVRILSPVQIPEEDRS